MKPRPAVPWQSVLSLVLALGYGVSPIDLIPDLIPLIGWVDDGVILVLLLGLAVFHFVRSRSRAAPSDPSWLTQGGQAQVVDVQVTEHPKTHQM